MEPNKEKRENHYGKKEMCKRKNKTKIREVGKYEGMQNEKILKERKRERERENIFLNFFILLQNFQTNII